MAANLLLLQSKITDGSLRAQSAPMWPATPIETAALRVGSGSEFAPKAKHQAERARTKPTWQAVQATHEGGVLSPGKIGVRSRFLPPETGNAVELVKALQRELKTKGYDPGAEDGRAGLVTQAAIFAYQYDHGLALTAEPTEALLQAIVLGQSGGKTSMQRRRTEVSGPAHDLVRLTQRGLKHQGFWSAAPNGNFDIRLSRAIQAFETSQQLPATGRISGRFMARLARLSGIVHTAAR